MIPVQDFPKEIILASASPRRRDLMQQLGLCFDIQPSNVDERTCGSCSPEELVSRLALLKAEDVAVHSNRSCLVIGADTIVVKDTVFGKPKDRQEAADMLIRLQGGWHEVITGVALVDIEAGYKDVSFERTHVEMMPLSRQQIEWYVQCGEADDKAGAYAIQGRAAAFVRGIRGCYTNVVGMPVHLLWDMLGRYRHYLSCLECSVIERL